MSLNYQAAVNITADFSGQGAIDKAKNSLGDLNKTASGTSGVFGELSDKVGGKLTGALKGLAAAFVVREVVTYSKSLIDLGQNLELLHQKTGIGVQTLSDLSAAAEQNGLELKGMETGLRKLSIAVAAANAGSETAQHSFTALGVSVQNSNGQLKPTGEILLEIADKFSKMQDGPNKAAIAVKLFGRAGADLIPLLNEGRNGIEGLGIEISRNFAQRADIFNDTLKQIGRNSKQTGVNLLEDMLPALQDSATALDKLTAPAERTAGSFSLIGESVKLIVGTVATIKTDFASGTDVIVHSFSVLGDELAAVGANVVNFVSLVKDQAVAAAHLNFDAVEKLNEDYQAKKAAIEAARDQSIDKRRDDLMKRQLERNKRLQDSFDALNGKDRPDPKENHRTGASNYIDDSGAAQQKKEAEAIAKLRDELKQLGQDRDLEAQKLDLGVVAYDKQRIAITESTKAAKASEGFTQTGKKAYAEITDEIIKQKQALIDLQEQQKQSFGNGAQTAWNNYLESARNVSSQTSAMFSRTFGGMEDSIVAFVQTGKLSFSSLADAIEADLLKIAIRQAIVFGVSSLTGAIAGGASGGGAAVAPRHMEQFANGGIMSGSGSLALHKYASGGVAGSPQLAMFGEGSKPEAFVPLPDGRSIPVAMKGNGSGGTSVMVNVTVEKGTAKEDSSTSDSDQGKQLGRMISSAVTQEIIKQKRPGGLLA